MRCNVGSTKIILKAVQMMEAWLLKFRGRFKGPFAILDKDSFWSAGAKE